jgi:hypothetical protein
VSSSASSIPGAGLPQHLDQRRPRTRRLGTGTGGARHGCDKILTVEELLEGATD